MMIGTFTCSQSVLTVPNVTVHLSRASVPIAVLITDVNNNNNNFLIKYMLKQKS